MLQQLEAAAGEVGQLEVRMELEDGEVPLLQGLRVHGEEQQRQVVVGAIPAPPHRVVGGELARLRAEPGDRLARLRRVLAGEEEQRLQGGEVPTHNQTAGMCDWR